MMQRKYSTKRQYEPIQTPDKYINKDAIIKEELDYLELFASFPRRMIDMRFKPNIKIVLISCDGNQRKERGRYQKIGEVDLSEFYGELGGDNMGENYKYIIQSKVKELYQRLIKETIINVKQLEYLSNLLINERQSIVLSTKQLKNKCEQLALQIGQIFKTIQLSENGSVKVSDVEVIPEKGKKNGNGSQMREKKGELVLEGRKNGNRKNGEKNSDERGERNRNALREGVYRINNKFLESGLNEMTYLKELSNLLKNRIFIQHERINNELNHNIHEWEQLERREGVLSELDKFIGGIEVIDERIRQDEIKRKAEIFKKNYKMEQKLIKSITDLINRAQNIKDNFSAKVASLDGILSDQSSFPENILFEINYFELRDRLKTLIQSCNTKKDNILSATIVYSFSSNYESCQHRLKLFQSIVGDVFGGYGKNLFKKRNGVYVKYYGDGSEGEEEGEGEEGSLASNDIEDIEDKGENQLEVYVENRVRHNPMKENMVARVLSGRNRRVMVREEEDGDNFYSDNQCEKDFNFYVWKGKSECGKIYQH